jgi:flagellar biosynthesis protein FliR
MSIGGYLLFFHTFGSAEFTSARKSKAKKPFFPLLFTHLFVTLAPPNFLLTQAKTSFRVLPLGKAKQKKHFFLCISLTYS